MSMVKVLNTRYNRTGKGEQVTVDGELKWTIIFDDNGEQKDIKSVTFDRWYKIITEEEKKSSKKSKKEEAPAPQPEPTPAPETTQVTLDDVIDAPTNETTPEPEKAPESAPEQSDKQIDELAKKRAEKDAEKAAKKIADEKAKADKEAAKAKEKEEKAKQREAEKAARELEKLAKEAEKAAKADAPKKKDVHKQFFQRFLARLNEVSDSVTKANARDRNYMSFPAGASGFKFKFVKNEGSLDCSLYIFGPAVVTTALFNELQKYKAVIDAQLGQDMELIWSAPEDMKVRRVRTKLTGSDEALIHDGVDTLIRFREVFIPLIDKITK